jgi:hypothetical protein
MANNVKAWQPSACFAGFVVMLWLSTPPALKGIRQSGMGAVIPASVASNATGKPSLPSKESLINSYKACFPETIPPPAITELDPQKFNDFIFECTSAKRQNKPLSKSARGILNLGYKACFRSDPPKAINKISDQHLAELIDDCAKAQKR